jgi:pimeloyl-ACP methyl ester carboxylesterase
MHVCLSPIANRTAASAAVRAPSGVAPRADQRLARRYCFDDPDMDLFFVAALGWGPAGGLDIGEAFYVASSISDGDPDSWVRSFANYGDALDAQASAWLARGWRRAAGEMRLKAFASYRSAWQFAAPGELFLSLYARHAACFAAALAELDLPATFFSALYRGKHLPGVFFRNERADAPVVLVIGGADTCFEDLFLTVGRNLFERGYSVALVDLPGQGFNQADGLYWEAEAERPIGAVIDVLIERFAAKPDGIALLGLSLGGYFVARAAGHESRLAAVMASTPFPDPAALFAASVQSMLRGDHGPASAAAARVRQLALWKAGASDVTGFLSRTATMVAHAEMVTLPFLSIVGGGDSPMFKAQAEAWHREIRSTHKRFVLLDAASGADGHVQVNGRLRLAQECCGWLDELFAARASNDGSGAIVA